MGIHHAAERSHWNYFLALEDDVSHLSRWIEFSEKNHDTYSIELARLLMASAAEADVVAKMICGQLDPNSKADSINKYQEVLVKAYPELPAATVSMPRHGLSFTPWVNWATAKTPPLWWTANNKVKHHRQDHFEAANLKNTLNAVAGLFVLEVLYYGFAKNSLTPAPNLLQPRAFARIKLGVLRLEVPPPK